MELLDTVFHEYAGTCQEMVAGAMKRRRVAGATASNVDIVIREKLPAFFKSIIADIGRDPDGYRVYGSTGQINFPYAKVPWVAILDRRISTSTERGYYIVLLFREDMQGCVLTLNQGYTEFEDEYVLANVAAQKIRESADRAAQYIDLPNGFTKGVVDLSATGDLGRGYEQGAIISRIYPRLTTLTEDRLASDIRALLEIYEILHKRVGVTLAGLVPELSEDEFQEAASIQSKKKNDYQSPPPGPVAVPPKVPGRTGGGYLRNPKVAGEALKRSNYSCEIDHEHKSFTCKRTKSNFVEAHHLVPMGQQESFKVSLDVVENIVALCPMCHRKLHHSIWLEKIDLLSSLFDTRKDGLGARSITISAADLYQLYKHGLEE